MCGLIGSNYIIIKDPVHGYIRVYSHERCLIDSPPFQRLRRMKQLPASHYVYPGAVHTRFSHSLGVAYVAGVFAEHLYGRLDGVDRAEKERLYYIARLLGLLHDIGHGPFSHTFEDDVLARYRTNHEVIGGRIVSEHPDVAKCFDEVIEKELGVSAKDMGRMIEAPNTETWPLRSVIAEGVSERSLYYIIKGPYSADIVDYLLRDSFFTGASYGVALDWERLAYHSRFVRDRPVLSYKGKDVLDSLLIARFFMFKNVYFHKTSRAFDKAIGDLLIRADEILGFREAVEDIGKYVELDDDYVISHPEVRKLEEARYLLNRVVPYKLAYEVMQSLEQQVKTLIRFSLKFLQESIIDNLRSVADEDIGEDAVFIDMPRLPTNPMFEESTIPIEYADGTIENVPVRNTIVGMMPSEVAFMRIYVKREFEHLAEKVRAIAMTLFQGREMRSFY